MRINNLSYKEVSVDWLRKIFISELNEVLEV